MKILNCDICGTSFPDTEEKCPTCGYSRAFVEEMMVHSTTHTSYERVRGGRFSKKNVLKRQQLREQQEEAEKAGEAANEKTERIESPVQKAQPEVQEQSDAVKENRELPSRAARRRNVWLNVALIVSVLAFLASVSYLAVHFGLIDIRALPEWIPAQITEFFAGEPEADVTGTEASTEMPTDTSAGSSDQVQSGTLSLNYTELTFNGPDQAVQLYCEGVTAGEITWTSENPAVATVSGSGQIVSVGPGTTYVWASHGGQSVKCVVSCNF